MNEIDVDDKPPVFQSSDYLVLAVVLYVIAAWTLSPEPLSLFEKRAVFGLFVLIGIGSFVPKSLAPLAWLWPRISGLLQTVAHTVLWGFLYFVLFVPFALVAQKFRKDQMRLKWRSYDSFWDKSAKETAELRDLEKAY
jgi:hypothetical protein